MNNAPTLDGIKAAIGRAQYGLTDIMAGTAEYKRPNHVGYMSRDQIHEAAHEVYRQLGAIAETIYEHLKGHEE